MIRELTPIDTFRLHAWLETRIKPLLKPDVSSYAKGRLRLWLSSEPSLAAPARIIRPAPIPDSYLYRLQDVIGWEFNFCLATYSGDGGSEQGEGKGIRPHRDAGYAAPIARTLQIAGEAQFNYWEDREARPSDKFTPYVIRPGCYFEFNCKHLHQCRPRPGRWALHFWRAK